MQILVGNATPLAHYNRFSSASTPAPSPGYVNTKPEKHWVIAASDITGPMFTYDCVTKDPVSHLPVWTTNTIGVIDALTLNIPPPTAMAGTTEAPLIAEPINRSAVLASGLELCTDIMGNAALCPVATPATTPTDWTAANQATLVRLDPILTRLDAYLLKQGF